MLDARTLHGLQDLVRRIPVSKGLIRAAVRLARMTRPADTDAHPLAKQYVEWGAGPRASQYLVLGAKARAALDGRPMADLDDVRTVALAVLRHRVVTNFAAEAADRTSEDIVARTADFWLGSVGQQVKQSADQLQRSDFRGDSPSDLGTRQSAVCPCCLPVQIGRDQTGKRASSPVEPALYGSQVAVDDHRDLLVGPSFQLPQDEDLAMDRRQSRDHAARSTPSWTG